MTKAILYGAIVLSVSVVILICEEKFPTLIPEYIAQLVAMLLMALSSFTASYFAPKRKILSGMAMAVVFIVGVEIYYLVTGEYRDTFGFPWTIIVYGVGYALLPAHKISLGLQGCPDFPFG